MKRIKKGLSLLLVIVLLLSSVGVGLGTINLKAEVPEATAPGASVTPAYPITFYVPEAIYLTPDATAATTFQYYIDRANSVGGAVTNAKAKTTGNVYFYCAGASGTNVSISVAAGGSATYSATTQNTKTYSGTINGGSVSPGVAQNETGLLTWTATYYIGGKMMTATAYTICYAPNIEPVGAAAKMGTWADATYPNDKHITQGFAYISGVQGYVTAGNQKFNQASSSATGVSPLLGIVTDPGTADYEWQWPTWLPATAVAGGVNYGATSGGNSNSCARIQNSPTGKLTVDVSRYNNINLIPNLTCGLVVTNTQNMRTNTWYYLDDYDEGTAYLDDGYTSTNASSAYSARGIAFMSQGSVTGTGIKFGGQTGINVYSNTLPAAGTDYNMRLKAAVSSTGGSPYNYILLYVKVAVTTVDKTALRNAVNKYIGYGLQAADYSGDYEAYQNALANAAARLGNPTSNDISTTTLDAAYTALAYTATIKYVAANGKFSDTDSPVYFNSGDTVTAEARTYTGYTLDTGTPSPKTFLNQIASFTYQFNYNPITYTIAYNGNSDGLGGTAGIGGTTGNSTHTYDEGKVLTTNLYTRAGYNFAGWNTAANGTGTSYSDKASVNNLTATNGATVTLYAKWALCNTVYFYVPETIYLTPAAGDASTFQYYVDSDTSGAPDKTKNKTAGVVYFSCADASSVDSITCSDLTASTLLLGSTFSPNGTLSTTVTGGTLSTPLAQNAKSTLVWTVTYTVNGKAMTAKAYTVCYAPYTEPVGAFSKLRFNNGAQDLQGFAYISGVQGYTAKTPGTANYKFNAGATPLLGDIALPNTDNAYPWYDSGFPTRPIWLDQTAGGVNYGEFNYAGNSQWYTHVENSPTGKLTVDTSRYTDINQIPNLTCGLVVTNTWGLKSLAKYYMCDYDDPNSAYPTTGNYDGATNFNNRWGNAGATGVPGKTKDQVPPYWEGSEAAGTWGIKYGGQRGINVYSNTITGTGTTYNMRLKAVAYYKDSSRNYQLINLINVDVYQIDKGTLRTAVTTYTNKGLQAADYSNDSADFAAYQAELAAASAKLGDPTNTDTSNTLLAKFSALTKDIYNATITHKLPVPNGASGNVNGTLIADSADGTTDGFITITETAVPFNSGDTVAVSPSAYTGYTIASATGSTTETSSQELKNQRAAVAVTYTYAPITYTVNYNANGGSNTMTDSMYSYNAHGSLRANTFAKTGYTFNGWNTAANGTGTSYPVNYDVYNMYTASNSLALYAQWSGPNDFDVTFNANTGSGSDYTQSITFGSSANLTSNTFTKTGYSFTGWNTVANGVGGTAYAAGALLTMDTEGKTLYAQWSIESYTITFDAVGGTGGTSGSMNFGDTLTPPTVTKAGFAFTGWDTSPPATVGEGNATYTAQWAETTVSATLVKVGEVDKLVINIVGYADDYSYQIWTYQSIITDFSLNGETNVQANQWILSQGYTPGSSGTPGAGGSINFTIDTFTSPNSNYTIAVRIIAGNGAYIGEMRDSYSPEVVGVAQIAKVLVDGEYVRGSSQEDRDNNIMSAAVIKEIKANAAPVITVIGNSATGITYTATVVETGETLTTTGNEFTWAISSLVPRRYTVRVTASKGATTDTWDIPFVLYMSAAPSVPYGVLNSMTLTGGTLYSAPQTININANFGNGYFYYRVQEAGRSPIYTSGELSTSSNTQTIEKYGIYRVLGYANRSAISPTGGYFDDGNAQTIEIKRAAGATTTTLTADKTLSAVNKGTAILFDSTATIAGIGTTDVEYSYWRQDAGGYVLVKDWSLDSTLAWTPGKVGNYKIEVRAKGVDAGSYEAINSVWVNVVSTEEIAKNVVFTINTAELNLNAKAWTPIVVKVSATSTSGTDLLYKFNVQEPMFDAVTKQNYSANQEFVWTPKKAGDYKISVLVKNQDSFGQFDAIEQFTVTVDEI